MENIIVQKLYLIMKHFVLMDGVMKDILEFIVVIALIVGHIQVILAVVTIILLYLCDRR